MLNLSGENKTEHLHAIPCVSRHHHRNPEHRKKHGTYSKIGSESRNLDEGCKVGKEKPKFRQKNMAWTTTNACKTTGLGTA